MKKKPTKKEPLVFTPEIRAYFREREVKRMEKFKKEIESLKALNSALRRDTEWKANLISKMKKEVQKLYTEVFK